MKKKERAINLLLNVDLLVATVALFVLVVVTFMGVIMRYFANSPIIWQEEVQLLCIVWMVFIGASAGIREGSHIVIDSIVKKMPFRLRNIVEYSGYMVTIAVFLYLLIQGSYLVEQLMRTERITNILKIPYFLIYGIMPVSLVLMIINQFIYVASKNKHKKVS